MPVSLLLHSWRVLHPVFFVFVIFNARHLSRPETITANLVDQREGRREGSRMTAEWVLSELSRSAALSGSPCAARAFIGDLPAPRPLDAEPLLLRP